MVISCQSQQNNRSYSEAHREFCIFASAKIEIMHLSHTEVEEQIDIDALFKDQNEIVLFNDDHHTFDFVIESLVDVCEHTMIQAEQCTYIVHHNGKCSVKKGEFEKLMPMCTALLNRGLSAEIH
jgi:ATP-dependent Clp protease adaptor protein ClpS